MKNKTVIFFGAGTTAELGFPLTGQQDKFLQAYFFAKTEDDFKKEIEKEFEKGIFKPSDDFVAELYSYKNNKTNTACRFDFAGLCKYVNMFFTKQSLSVMSLFNLLDMQRQSKFTFGQGSCTGNPYPPFYPEQLEHIRRALVVLLAMLMGDAMQNANKDMLHQYKDFFKSLAKVVLQDKWQQLQNGKNQVDSDFILSDLTYISLNWDPVILWVMFNAHKELNDCNCMYWTHDKGNAKLKIFNDFAIPLAAKPIQPKHTEKRWYPYSEAVAQRINDPEHLHERVVTLIRTLLPHGQTNWLVCPKCGKVSMYLGSNWELESKTLPMENPPLTEKDFRNICTSCGDKDEQGVYHCVHCGYMLTLADALMLMQTVNKEKSSFLEEIQTDMRLRIAEAERIIFVGYSLPDDDFEYRSIFAGLSRKVDDNGNQLKTKKKVYVVQKEDGMPGDWLSYGDTERMLKEQWHKDTAKRFEDLFGEITDLKFNWHGFPNADEKIIELLEE